MSTYGAKPAPAAVPSPGVPVGVGVVGVPVGAGSVVSVAVGVGVGVGVGAGGSVGRPLGSGVAPSSVEQAASSTRQPVGSAVPLTTKPTVTDSPAFSPSVSHFGGVTVTCCPSTFDSAFHSEPSFAPAGRSNSSVQSAFACPLVLVTTYWAV